MPEEAPRVDTEGKPVAGAPASPAPTITVDTLTAALKGAIAEVIPGYVQRTPQTQQPHVPANPIDLLPKEQQDRLAELSIADPAAYGRTMSELGARHAQMRFEAAAKPYQETNARLLVSDFRNRMQAAESSEDFRVISPEFDKIIRGLDLTPLTVMNEESRSAELILRWNAAKGVAFAARAKEEASRKPDPLLTPSGSSLSSPAGGDKKLAPWLERMRDGYKLTPEQLKEIEATQ